MIGRSNRIGWGFRRLSASFALPSAAAIPIWFAGPDNWEALREAIGSSAARFAAACGFAPKAGRCKSARRGGRASPACCSAGRAAARGRDPLAPGALASALPEGVYRFANAPHEPELAALGVPARALSLRPLPRRSARPGPRLIAPEGVEAGAHRAHRRGGRLRPRPRQHARQRSRAGRAGAARRRASPKNSAPASK